MAKARSASSAVSRMLTCCAIGQTASLPNHVSHQPGKAKSPEPPWGFRANKLSVVPPEFGERVSPHSCPVTVGTGGAYCGKSGSAARLQGAFLPPAAGACTSRPLSCPVRREYSSLSQPFLSQATLSCFFPFVKNQQPAKKAQRQNPCAPPPKRARTCSLSRITCSFTASREAILLIGRRKRYTVSAISCP